MGTSDILRVVKTSGVTINHKMHELFHRIFINVRNRFQSKKMTGFNFGCGNPPARRYFCQKSTFLIKTHVSQYLNKMSE